MFFDWEEAGEPESTHGLHANSTKKGLGWFQLATFLLWGDTANHSSQWCSIFFSPISQIVRWWFCQTQTMLPGKVLYAVCMLWLCIFAKAFYSSFGDNNLLCLSEETLSMPAADQWEEETHDFPQCHCGTSPEVGPLLTIWLRHWAWIWRNFGFDSARWGLQKEAAFSARVFWDTCIWMKEAGSLRDGVSELSERPECQARHVVFQEER